MEFGQTLNELRVELANCIGADKAEGIPWSWVATTVSRILSDHSSGVSRAVVLAELESAWHQYTSSEEQDSAVQRTLGGFFHRGNTAPALTALFELRIVALEQLAHTSIWMWRLSGSDTAPKGMLPPRHSASKQMSAFVHQRFYPMIESAEFEGFFGGRRALYLAGLRGTACEEELKLLPTTSAVFVLQAGRDARLMRDFFGVEVVDNQPVLAKEPAFDAGQVWGVVDIVLQSGEDHATPHCAVVEIAVCPAGGGQPRLVAVEFRGADISLAQAFHRGDCLGLVCAAAENSSTLSYGAQTLAFVLPAAVKVPEATATGVRSPRVWLSQLRPETSGLTLLVRVMAVSANMPADNEPFRRAMRVSDGTAACDATVWGALAQRVAQLRAGQTVLMRKFEAHEEQGGVVLNGGLDIGSAIDNVSAFPAVPHSAALRRLESLDRVRAPASRYVRASVTRVEPLLDEMRDSRDLAAATKLVHALCGRRIVRASSGALECAKCAAPVADTRSVFALAVDLDDGTAVAHARVAAHVAAMMLATTPEHFLKLPSRAAQLAALAKPLGQAFVVCLTAFTIADSSNETLLRIDAACPADDVGILE
ncbi:hypothetical protein GGI08_003465 [Coemansia sp. S2]|nr:hypothetical protein GGI08_003465 [Coemansia sp. S2]KAJ2353412.1 hypothetical protein GGH92_000669 [Coemansia sp. RSA 2673]